MGVDWVLYRANPDKRKAIALTQQWVKDGSSIITDRLGVFRVERGTRVIELVEMIERIRITQKWYKRGVAALGRRRLC